MHAGQYGAYVNFLQRVTTPAVPGSTHGVSVFFNATFADRRTSTLDNQIAAGVFYTGPFAARPADKIGLAIGRTHVNSRIVEAERQQNAAGLGPVGVQSSETWVRFSTACMRLGGWSCGPTSSMSISRAASLKIPTM